YDVAPSPNLAGDLRRQLAGNGLGKGSRTIQEQRAAAVRTLAREADADLALRFRPDSLHLAKSPGVCGRTQLVCSPDSQLAAERHHPLWAQADEASERDELRLDLALELFELAEPPGGDELLEAPLDARTDPAQLACAAGPHQLCDRGTRLADQLGRAPVCARRVVAGACELEQGGVRLQRLRDLCILHVGRATLPATSLVSPHGHGRHSVRRDGGEDPAACFAASSA